MIIIFDVGLLKPSDDAAETRSPMKNFCEVDVIKSVFLAVCFIILCH